MLVRKSDANHMDPHVGITCMWGIDSNGVYMYTGVYRFDHESFDQNNLHSRISVALPCLLAVICQTIVLTRFVHKYQRVSNAEGSNVWQFFHWKMSEI